MRQISLAVASAPRDRDLRGPRPVRRVAISKDASALSPHVERAQRHVTEHTIAESRGELAR